MKVFISILLLLLATGGAAQDKVKWQYAAAKKSNDLYEIRLSASLQRGWHIYSQATPEGGPVPTKITFMKNPLLTLEGAVQEYGKKQQKYEEVFEVMTSYYASKVEFVQLVRLKKSARTSIGVAVEYMICSNEQCLPPTTQKFTVALN